MTHEELSAIGYRTRKPVPLPAAMRVKCGIASRLLALQVGIEPARAWRAALNGEGRALRVSLAKELYAAFPFPTLLAREFGVSVNTFRWWLRRPTC